MKYMAVLGGGALRTVQFHQQYVANQTGQPHHVTHIRIS